MKCIVCSEELNSEGTCTGCGANALDDMPSLVASTPQSASAAPPPQQSLDDLDDMASMASAPASAPSPPGELIPAKGYEVVRILGVGGMGVVYEARQKIGSKTRPVAIKRIRQDNVSEEAVQLFLAEAETVALLSHPNLGSVYTLSEDEYGHFIVMEYVGGGSLLDLIRKEGKIGEDQAIKLTRGIARGVAHAHSKNVLHRDLKPANVLLTEEGLPKVVDFGLARAVEGADRTQAEQVLGTLFYMPPEQRLNPAAVDRRADVYALGKTLYHMITGALPETIDLEEVPDSLKDAIRKSVKRDREERFQTVDEFVAALEGSNAKSSGPVLREKGLPPTGYECLDCLRPVEKEARFCQCGAPTHDNCQACEGEIRRGLAICPMCGVSLKRFRELRELLAKARRDLLKAPVNHTAQSLQVLLGKETKEPGYKPVREPAEELGVRLEKLKQNLSELNSAMASGDVGGVERCVEAATAARLLHSDHQAFANWAEEQRALQDLASTLFHLETSIESGRLATARQTLEAARQRFGALQELETMQLQLETEFQNCRLLLEGAEHAFHENDLESASRDCEKVLSMEIAGTAVEEAEQRAEALAQAIQLVSSAVEQLQPAYSEEDLSGVDAILGDLPDEMSEHIAIVPFAQWRDSQLGTLELKIEEAHLRLSEAQGARAQGRYLEAIALVDQALDPDLPPALFEAWNRSAGDVIAQSVEIFVGAREELFEEVALSPMRVSAACLLFPAIGPLIFAKRARRLVSLGLLPKVGLTRYFSVAVYSVFGAICLLLLFRVLYFLPGAAPHERVAFGVIFLFLYSPWLFAATHTYFATEAMNRDFRDWDGGGNRMAEAMFELGAACGAQGLPADAFRWYQKAAKAGHSRGMAGVANCYMTGTGVSRDYAEGIRWYRKAADAGHQAAAEWLAESREWIVQQGL